MPGDYGRQQRTEKENAMRFRITEDHAVKDYRSKDRRRKVVRGALVEAAWRCLLPAVFLLGYILASMMEVQ